MARTDRFRQQHNEILRIAKQVADLLKEELLGKDANRVRVLLAGLAVQVKYHLSLEDQWVYPELLKSDDHRVRALATRYMTEMGGIKAGFEQYVNRWGTPQAIESRASVFMSETKSLFNLLAKRIQLENTELYPALDKAA